MDFKKKILVVEDDESIQRLLVEKLSLSFDVQVTESINLAQRILSRKFIDLICLDIMLPDGNGFDLCKIVKKDFPETKVIVLSKKATGEDRIKCFNSGADDYLPKPFFPEELELRAKKLLREDKELIESKESKLRLNRRKGELLWDKTTTLLTPTQTLLFEYFLLHNGYKTSENILKYINSKNGGDMNKRAFTVFISRLKKKLELNTGMGIIKVRYGKGYYLAI